MGDDRLDQICHIREYRGGPGPIHTLVLVLFSEALLPPGAQMPPVK